MKLLLHYLDHQTIMAIRSTSQAHMFMIGNQMRILSHSVFRYFGFDPQRFHYHLHSTQSIISGPAALVALFPGQLQTSTMDIYVSYSRAAELLYFLQTSADYMTMFGPFKNIVWKGLHGFTVLFSSKKNKTIHVYISDRHSALAPILGSKSTLAMNLITGMHNLYIVGEIHVWLFLSLFKPME